MKQDKLKQEHYQASKSPTPKKGTKGIEKTRSPRNIRNVVRMNKAEQKQLEALAEQLKMNLSELFRYSVRVLADSLKSQ